ncbi:ABC transporter transmembrane domain-containing protein [uncultured Sulfitobacter sp.]|uniref:ABC transporter transmembrane domain-containing protein n=1 Tax=uncultured Sulfitobacter sp. TaxID=191468 RepID=UPI0030D9D203|tara:strand:+ start:3013 stop:4422 length:1410 start_codon:yes stop_codon:yes gene_type:complete
MTLDITTQGLIDQAAHAADTAGDGILALRYVARSFRLSFSEQAVRSSVAWSAENASDHIATIGEQVGLAFTSIAANPKKIDAFACPLILVRPDGQTLVIESLSQDGTAEFVSFSRTETDRNEMPLTQLLEPGARLWKVRPRRSLPDARIDAYIAPARKNWLRKILFPSLAPYLTVILASVMVNMLGLSGILFSTQVYDRVIPAQSMNTLAVLFGGVAIAYTFEFLLRVLRGVLLDKLGQDAGQSLSNLVFGRALRIRSDRRPASTGSFISQMRDIDRMREVLTSTSVGVVMDLPFFLLFCFIFWMIAGQLIVIPLVALLVILVPGLVLQPKLKSAAQQAQRESALRNAVLVEAIQGIDDIKALQAEERFQGHLATDLCRDGKTTVTRATTDFGPDVLDPDCAAKCLCWRCRAWCPARYGGRHHHRYIGRRIDLGRADDGPHEPDFIGACPGSTSADRGCGAERYCGFAP